MPSLEDIANHRSLERSLLGDTRSVYPGHPVVIATLIMAKYSSMAEALERSGPSNYHAALSDSDIPGAGGHVYLGLDVLRKVFADGAQSAFAWGSEQWSRSVEHGYQLAHDEGQAQAEHLRARFLTAADAWPMNVPA